MMYIAPSVLLTLEDATSLQYPLILWNNLVTVAGLAADEEDADYPASNLANPQTSSLWKSGSTADQYVTVTLDGDTETDCLGIARHNLGSGACGITIEGITAEDGAVWEELATVSPGADDAPVIVLFEAGFYTGIRLFLEPGSVEPQAAVLYLGKALKLTKGIVPGFVPPPDALQTELLTGFAENGDFLGDIITSERRATSLSLRPLPGDWYRDNIRGFLQARVPFFLAWSPASHPEEASFAKFGGDPQAVMNQANGRFDVSFSLTGLAL